MPGQYLSLFVAALFAKFGDKSWRTKESKKNQVQGVTDHLSREYLFLRKAVEDSYQLALTNRRKICLDNEKLQYDLGDSWMNFFGASLDIAGLYEKMDPPYSLDEIYCYSSYGNIDRFFVSVDSKKVLCYDCGITKCISEKDYNLEELNLHFTALHEYEAQCHGCLTIIFMKDTIRACKTCRKNVHHPEFKEHLIMANYSHENVNLDFFLNPPPTPPVPFFEYEERRDHFRYLTEGVDGKRVPSVTFTIETAPWRD